LDGSNGRTSIRRKFDAYHRVIDLEKPSISGDAIEAIGSSSFGNLANQNGKSALATLPTKMGSLLWQPCQPKWEVSGWFMLYFTREEHLTCRVSSVV
jgi:hypothetical protein